MPSAKPTVGVDDLEHIHPILAKEWHPTRNGELKPSDFKAGSGKKVWWQCSKYSTHEWEGIIINRTTNGNGCPICSGRMVLKGFNDLEHIHPILAKEWHPTRNGDLKPSDVTKSSGRKVWWQCPLFSHHAYEATISHRTTMGSGCSYCSGKKVVPEKSLANCFPQIAKEWHPIRNGDLTPNDVTKSSSKKVWWQCPKFPNHEWEVSVGDRTRENGFGCPYCAGKKVCPENSLAVLAPEIAKEWHPTLNGDLTPNDVTKSSGKEVWWQCPRFSGHEWQSKISTRWSMKTGCPLCSYKSSRAELRIFSELSGVFSNVRSRAKIEGKEIDIWLPEESIGIEFDGFFYHKDSLDKDREKVFALMEKGILLIRVREIPLKAICANDIETKRGRIDKEDIDNIIKRIQLSGRCSCEVSAKRINDYLENDTFFKEKQFQSLVSNLGLPAEEETLAFCFPEIAKEWHPTKNGELTPDCITSRNSQKVWWQCPKKSNHEWETAVSTRTSGSGCPFCSGQAVSPETSLAFRFPKIAEQWHPTKNGDLSAEDFTTGSEQMVWWVCPNFSHHEWECDIGSRVRGRGCPFCAGKRVSPENSLAICFPKISKEWHPTRNGDLSPNDVTKNSGRRVWWQCLVNLSHEWDAVIKTRTRTNPSGCPHCYREKRGRPGADAH